MTTQNGDSESDCDYLVLTVSHGFLPTGERCQKDIFEALRAGKGWAKTMFLIVCKCLRRLRCLHAAVFSVAVFVAAWHAVTYIDCPDSDDDAGTAYDHVRELLRSVVTDWPLAAYFRSSLSCDRCAGLIAVLGLSACHR